MHLKAMQPIKDLKLLYDWCGNPLAAQLFEITWKVRLHASDHHIAISEIQPGTVAEQAAILAAIKQGNVALARERRLAYHNNSADSFRAQIEQQVLQA